MPTKEDMYTETTTALARDAGVTQATVRNYVRLGLLDYIKASNGVVLLAKGQAPKVREIYAQRMAARFRRTG
jgi:hypothetical protein